MSDKNEKIEGNLETEYLFSWYGKLSNLLKWIIFLPIAGLLATLLVLPIYFIGETVKLKFLSFLLGLLHAFSYQFFLLISLKYLIPKNRKRIVTIIVILRSLFLLVFIAQPILILLGVEMQYDSIFFEELLGEVLILVMSLKLLKEFENVTLSFCRSVLKYTFYTYLWLIAWFLLELTLEFLSGVPVIGGLFRYIRYLRNTVY